MRVAIISRAEAHIRPSCNRSNFAIVGQKHIRNCCCYSIRRRCHNDEHDVFSGNVYPLADPARPQASTDVSATAESKKSIMLLDDLRTGRARGTRV